MKPMVESESHARNSASVSPPFNELAGNSRVSSNKRSPSAVVMFSSIWLRGSRRLHRSQLGDDIVMQHLLHFHQCEADHRAVHDAVIEHHADRYFAVFG